jgi:3-hydroxyisobutyrate dehydrogenase
MARKIGFVGLGSMGLPMAMNLVTGGFEVRGFDLAPEAVAELARAGGVAATSTADAAVGAEFLVLMVVNAAQAGAVLFDAGAVSSLPEGGTVVLMSTCAPGEVADLATRVGATRRRFIDAPVSGGVTGAKSRGLTIMAAAPEPLFEEARPVFEALGGRIFHVGSQSGQGAAMKTLNQLLCGVHLAAAAEALAFASTMGVDAGVALRILGGSSAASWMLADRGPRMLEAEPAVTSSVDIFVKDLGIVLEAGREARVPLPLAAIAHQMFLATSGSGKGEADDSQVVHTYRSMGRDH